MRGHLVASAAPPPGCGSGGREGIPGARAGWGIILSHLYADTGRESGTKMVTTTLIFVTRGPLPLALPGPRWAPGMWVQRSWGSSAAASRRGATVYFTLIKKRFGSVYCTVYCVCTALCTVYTMHCTALCTALCSYCVKTPFPFLNGKSGPSRVRIPQRARTTSRVLSTVDTHPPGPPRGVGNIGPRHGPAELEMNEAFFALNFATGVGNRDATNSSPAFSRI